MRLKNSEQIEGIRRSARLLAVLLEELAARVEPGVSPLQLDRYAYQYIARTEGRPAFLGYRDFRHSICASVNDVVIHGIPTNTPLREGDVIGIDCGIDLGGFVSDAAVTVAVGEISPEVRQLMKTAEESLYLGIEQAVLGNRVKDISRAVFRHNKAKGYGVVRKFQGHSVGFSVHEEDGIDVPNYVARGANPRLRPGMVLAIEPMITMGGDDVRVADDGWSVRTVDHSIAVHYEHDVAITANGVEILSRRD